MFGVTSRMEAFVSFLTFWRRAFIGFVIGMVLSGIADHFIPFFGTGVFDAVLVLGIVVWVVVGVFSIALGAYLCRAEEQRVRDEVDFFVERLGVLADRHAAEMDAVIAGEDARFDGLTEYQKGVVISRAYARIREMA